MGLSQGVRITTVVPVTSKAYFRMLEERNMNLIVS